MNVNVMHKLKQVSNMTNFFPLKQNVSPCELSKNCSGYCRSVVMLKLCNSSITHFNKKVSSNH